jgi:hypothetical protein
VHTPVDLSVYSSVKALDEERLAANGGRVVLARRPSIEMPSLNIVPAASPATAAQTELGLEDLDAPGPFDIPAFLRRKEG